MKTRLSIFICLFLSACGAEHDLAESFSSVVLNPNPDPQLEAQATDILTSQCLTCHGTGGPNQKFLGTSSNLELDSLMFNASYVRIGEGGSSRLFQRASDGSMPPGNPLSSAEADILKDWINDLGTPGGSGRGGNVATFTQIETEILRPRCYSCHENNANFPFSSYEEILFGYVTPNNLDSVLLVAVESGRMPKNGEALTPEEVALIESWILDGAPNN